MLINFSIRSSFLSVALVVPLFFFTGFTRAQQGVSEVEVKAVFIYNFLMFVEWPESAFENPTDPFVVGIAGENVFGNALLEVVRGEAYKGRRIVIKQIADIHDAGNCHILYIDPTDHDYTEIIKATQGKPVLTVGGPNDFMASGGMIRFFLEQNKVKIEVNPNEIREQELKISSKLLRLARIYNE